MRRIVIFFILLLSLNCWSHFFPIRVIGENDLTPANPDAPNIPEKYKKLIYAVGFIDSGCTVTHIGNGYALSAGHCFWSPPKLTENVNCDDIKIQWGFFENAPAYMVSRCEMILFEQRNSVNDFAIIKVSPIPKTYVEIELNRKAQQGDDITIFSHPNQKPLHWSKNCIVEKVLSNLFSPETLQHKCDTEPGSSGAAILDVNTLKIVGIHNGGRTEGQVDGMNYGTYMTNDELLQSLHKLGFR